MNDDQLLPPLDDNKNKEEGYMIPHRNENYTMIPSTLESLIKDEIPDKKTAITGFLIGSIGYMILFPLFFIIILLNFNFTDTFSNILAQILGGIISIALSFAIISRESCRNILKGFLQVKNLGVALLGVLAMFGANILANIITISIFGEIESNANQQSLEHSMLSFPLMICILTVFIAPFIEELIYRHFIFKGLIKVNRTLAFVVSILGFVSIHYIASIGSDNILNEFKGVLGYLIPAFVLTYLYYKNKNLATNIMVHSIYNLIMVLLMFA